MDSVALKREAISAVLFLDDYGPTTSVFINANRCNHSIGLNTLQNLTLRLKIERTDFFFGQSSFIAKGVCQLFFNNRKSTQRSVKQVSSNHNCKCAKKVLIFVFIRKSSVTMEDSNLFPNIFLNLEI